MNSERYLPGADEFTLPKGFNMGPRNHKRAKARVTLNRIAKASRKRNRGVR